MVFLGLCDICGYYSELERGLLRLNVRCTLVNAFPDRPYPRTTAPGLLGRIVETIAARRIAASRGSVGRRVWTLLQAIAMAFLLVWSLLTCRVFVFAGGTSFFPPYDLRILKAFGKRVILVFHGSDARPPYINGAFECAAPHEVAACIAQAAAMKQRISRIEAHADVILNHVLSSQFHGRPVVKWLEIGIPRDVSIFAPTPGGSGAKCVIVHAPTRPGPKGSPLIEAAIERLSRRGYDIEFVKLVGRPPADVIEQLRRCDFVVDELFSDTTMASFAAEAASFGKAAVVGLHGYDVLAAHTATGLLPPAMVCQAAEVESAIERLVADRTLREQMGADARRFLEQHWNSVAVAERFVRLIEDRIPPGWYFDPAAVMYQHGWGLTDADARARVAAVIARGGVGALQLHDKPALQRSFEEFGAAS